MVEKSMAIALRPGALLGAVTWLALSGAPALAGGDYSKNNIPKSLSGVFATPCSGPGGSGSVASYAGDTAFLFSAYDGPSSCQGALALNAPNGTAVNGNASIQWTVNGPYGPVVRSGSSKAAAGYGWAKMGASAQLTGTGQEVDSVSQGGWADIVTIVPANPALNGTKAHLDFWLHMDGTLQISQNLFDGPFAEMRVSAYSDRVIDVNNPGSDVQFALGNAWPAGGATTLVVNQTKLMSLSFTLGQSFQMGIYARASAWDGVPLGWFFGPNSSASADFSNTFTWQGVNAVTVNGAPIGFTMTSATGVDWLQPLSAVPEASHGAMLHAGLLLMCGLQARRAGSHQASAGR
jgi:hypothetical protein